MSADVQAAVKDADRVCKKQKICASKTSEGLQSLLQEVARARDELASNPSTQAAACLAELQARIVALDVPGQAATHTKELHSAVSKLGKAIDKAFVADVCKATRDIDFDHETLNQVVAEHLFQEGRFEAGEAFVAEAGLPDGEQLKEPFIAMHKVLKEIRNRNLAPALAWIHAHLPQLTAAGVAESFEFKLHRLQYLHVLTTQGQAAALTYARAHFTRFKGSQLADIQRLMGCLCYLRRLESSPYADLLSPAQWDDFAREFAKQCCGLMGQACESPLLVTVAAGAAALPPLLKLATVMAGQAQDLRTCEQLPLELELGREFVFHSIFACPVSRDQASAENPPMLLPCGHVLCRVSIVKIAKNSSRTFKCPYCPVEATLGTCKQLHFPSAD